MVNVLALCLVLKFRKSSRESALFYMKGAVCEYGLERKMLQMMIMLYAEGLRDGHILSGLISELWNRMAMNREWNEDGA